MRYAKRAAERSDYEWLYDLRRATYREVVIRQFGAWDESFQRRCYETAFDPLHTAILICDGDPMGMVCKVRRPEFLWLAQIQIAPAWHGKGIGTEVIRDLIAEARALGIPLRLRVLHENTRAKRLYDILGFEVIETTEHHFVMEIA